MFKIWLRTPEMSTAEMSTQEMSTPEMSTQEMSTPEMSTPEMSTPEMSTPFVPLHQKMLRPATYSDVDFIYQLYMHPLVNPYLLYEPMDADSFKPIYQELLRQEVKFVYCQDEKAIGMCKLVPFTHRSAHVIYLGGLAIHPDANGQGHGERMIREIQEFVKQRNFLRIDLSVDEKNEKAIRLYKRCGFEQEGFLRKYAYLKSENRFNNEILMAFLF